MIAVDPRVAAALRLQLEDWRQALARGAERVGWKIGLNIPEVQERLGLEEPVIGHLTSATRLEPGGVYRATGAVALRAEPEAAVEMGRDVEPDAEADAAREAIAGLAPALELVDVGRPPDGPDGIVAANVFHRAFALGPSQPPIADGMEATVLVDGQARASAPVPDDFADVVLVVARHLGAAGERLRKGDRIIAGSLTEQLEVGPGDHVAVEMGRLGRLELRVA